MADQDGRLSAELAEAILDQLPVAVFVTDKSGSPCYANRASDELLGREATAVGEASTLARILGARRAGTADPYPDEDMPILRALAGEAVSLDDMEIARPGFDPFPIQVSAGPVRGANGVVVNAVAVFWDITGRREAERDSALLASIVESTDDAIVSIDLSGWITSWNRGAEVLYAYTEAEAIGAPVAVLMPIGEDPAALIERAIGGGPGAHTEVVRLRKDRSRVIVDETVSAVRDTDGRIIGAAAITRDITARLEGEEQLAVARRHLEARNRDLERSNAELEQFAYVASHDLSEPLRAVAGMVELLERRYRGRLDDDADEFIAFAVDGCERMRSMIEDLLAFSRVSRVELRLHDGLDVGELVATVIKTLEPQIEAAGATVHAGELATIRADRTQLTQLLQNLISNAVKFRRPDVTPIVRVSARHDGRGAWTFEVSDNGIGIEEQHRTRIFRMFRRLHPADAYPGTGIGLAIAERIVDRHGGRIGVTDNAAGGSSFWFTIPDRAKDGGQ